MRKELLYNPRLVLERLGEMSRDRRRLAKLKRTVASGLNDDHITSLEFLELANKNATIKAMYDLGANMGVWTLLANSIIPDAVIHAFEPIPRYQENYLQATGNISKATLHKLGVGSENKTAVFNIAGHSSSFLEVSENLLRQFPNERKTGELEVTMVRLDDYVVEHKLPLPDLMKLDVEGYELEVLKGAEHCMAHCKYMILEVSFIERHIGQALFSELAGFMARHNYEVCAFPYGMGLGQELFASDVLFKNRNPKAGANSNT